YKTPLGTTLFRIIYGKACHLPVELERKAYWAIKACNMDLAKAGDNRKLKSRWYGPFEVSKDTENRAIKLYYKDGNEFIVNKQRVKPYQKDALIVDKDEDITVADEGEVIELKKLIEKLKGQSADTKIEKSSVIQQPNAFKSPRPSVLGKPTTFSNSFIRTDFSKSTSVTKNNVSNDFSKPVTTQTLPTKKKSCLKNTNVLAPGMYKIHTDHTQARTSKLPQDSKKSNKN
nr:hypothetical protein [Tanacetum cinerariifolium]